jgi:hypothetical protein
MLDKIIEFVSYNGEYPNLCSGDLVLRVYNTVDSFDCSTVENFSEEGSDLQDYKEYTFDHILSSGGSCSYDNNGDDICYHGDWTIEEYNLPDELKPYKKKIEELVNDNVPKGCCGGCL